LSSHGVCNDPPSANPPNGAQRVALQFRQVTPRDQHAWQGACRCRPDGVAVGLRGDGSLQFQKQLVRKELLRPGESRGPGRLQVILSCQGTRRKTEIHSYASSAKG